MHFRKEYGLSMAKIEGSVIHLGWEAAEKSVLPAVTYTLNVSVTQTVQRIAEAQMNGLPINVRKGRHRSQKDAVLGLVDSDCFKPPQSLATFNDYRMPISNLLTVPKPV